MQLITIQQQTINNQNTNAVSARELHLKLELKTEFTHWVKQFLDDFTQGTDFIRIEGKLNPTNNIPTIDYAFTLDMAKQVAMLTRTPKGKEVRLYFIECEKRLHKPMTITEIVAHNAQLLLNLERQQEELKQRLLEVESKALATQENYYTMSGYCNLKGLKFDDKELANLGRQASKISKLRNVEIKKFHSAKFGTVNQYDVNILSEIV